MKTKSKSGRKQNRNTRGVEQLEVKMAFTAAAATLRSTFSGDDIPKREAARQAFAKAFEDYRATL